jgi:hypothetical protein
LFARASRDFEKMFAENLVFNLFKKDENTLWRYYTPCPMCHGNALIKCPFGENCAFPRTEKEEVFDEMKRMLVKLPVGGDDEGDMMLTFKFFLKKHGIVVKTQLCNRPHHVDFNEACSHRGFAHNVDELLEGFRHLMTRRYFYANNKQVDNGFMLPARFLQCEHCPVGRQKIRITIYTHFPDGRLRMPVCNLCCDNCSNQSYYSLYENLL